jgi:L-glutamine-phosphate cytidylyltransferase
MGDNTLQTAVILAAGLGSRLRPLTNDRPKCLVEVDGKPMLQRMLDEVVKAGFSRVVIVTGYHVDVLMRWYDANPQPIQIEWVHNEVFDTTNNIYSVYKLIPTVSEGFVLIEADLLLEPGALDAFRIGNRMALARYNPEIHSGTTADIDDSGNVHSLYLKRLTDHSGAYKTVNITSFTSHTWSLLADHISALIEDGQDQIFYEHAIQHLLESSQLVFECVDFTSVWWDEVDSVEDLYRVIASLRQHAEIEV